MLTRGTAGVDAVVDGMKFHNGLGFLQNSGYRCLDLFSLDPDDRARMRWQHLRLFKSGGGAAVPEVSAPEAP